MRPAKTPAVLALVCSVIVAIAGIVIFRQASHLRAYERQHAQDVSSLQQLRAGPRQQAGQSSVPSAMPPGSPGPAAGCATSQEISDLAARAALSDRLQADLHEAHASMARLQGQLDSFERDKETASAACSENIQKCEQDARGRLEALEKDLDSARGEAESARASRERAASLGTENAKLKSDNGAVSAQIAELRKAMASLQDLDRRRDGYLNSVSRRYHEITEQFRAMTSTIDSNRASGSSFSDVALSRIQNATALAEEDLRRLNELNAQAHQIENRMAKN